MNGVRIISGGDLPGLRALADRVRAKGRALVGVPAGKAEPDGTSMAEVAAVNEFGSEDGRIPERSFLRAGTRAHVKDLRDVAAPALRRVAEGTGSMTQALEVLGQAGAGGVKRYIAAEGQFAPNAPSTIAKKGSEHPLIASSQLLQSITSVVEGA